MNNAVSQDDVYSPITHVTMMLAGSPFLVCSPLICSSLEWTLMERSKFNYLAAPKNKGNQNQAFQLHGDLYTLYFFSLHIFWGRVFSHFSA
jgi:hypothetical protein